MGMHWCRDAGTVGMRWCRDASTIEMQWGCIGAGMLAPLECVGAGMQAPWGCNGDVLLQGMQAPPRCNGDASVQGCWDHRDAMGMHCCRGCGTMAVPGPAAAAGPPGPPSPLPAGGCSALSACTERPPAAAAAAALPCTALPPPGAAGRAVHAPNPQPTPAVHWGGGSVVGLCPGGWGGAATLLPPQIWRLCWPTCAPFCSSSTGRASAPQPEPRSSRWESCCNGCRARRVSATGSRRCRGGTEGGCDSDPPPLTPQQQQRMQST